MKATVKILYKDGSGESFSSEIAPFESLSWDEFFKAKFIIFRTDTGCISINLDEVRSIEMVEV